MAVARKQLIADRFHRIWRIIEDIAQEPGKGRRQLADKYALSERQVQADLNLIRSDMGLPLIRRQGYRFEVDRTANSPTFTLREAQILLLALRQLSKERTVLQSELTALLRKLPWLFPPHLRPLADRTLQLTSSKSGNADDGLVFATLSDATVRKGQVKLHYPPEDMSSPVQDPIVNAELLLPYRGTWYLIGLCEQRRRVMMFDLEGVTSVTPLFRA